MQRPRFSINNELVKINKGCITIMSETISAKSCWTCLFQDLDNETFLGKCRFFEKRGKPAAEIPPEMVDKGCAHFEEKTTPQPQQ
jgi:hypothetical protein